MYICGHMVHSSGMEYRVCFSFAFGRSIRSVLSVRSGDFGSAAA